MRPKRWRDRLHPRRLPLVALLVVAFLALLALTVRAQSGGGYDLSWHTVDGGGGSSGGGGYRLDGTVGQADAGESSGGNYVLSGGFWAGVPCSLPVAAAALAPAGIEFTWSGGTYDVYRAVDAPYFTGGTQIGFTESSGWTYAESLVSDPAQNAYYLVGASAQCGKRLGEFDFTLQPGN